MFKKTIKGGDFLFDKATMQLYLDGVEKLFSENWINEKYERVCYHMEIKASDPSMETKLPDFFDLIEVFVNKTNEQVGGV